MNHLSTYYDFRECAVSSRRIDVLSCDCIHRKMGVPVLSTEVGKNAAEGQDPYHQRVCDIFGVPPDVDQEGFGDKKFNRTIKKAYKHYFGFSYHVG